MVFSIIKNDAHQKTGNAGVRSARWLAGRAGIHVSTFWRAVAKLTEAGWLRREPTWSCVDYGMRGPNRWWVPAMEAGRPVELFGEVAESTPAAEPPAAPVAGPAGPRAVDAFFRDPLASFDAQAPATRRTQELPSRAELSLLGTYRSGESVEKYERNRWDRILGTSKIDPADRKSLRSATVLRQVGRSARSDGLTEYVVEVPENLVPVAERCWSSVLEHARESSIALVLYRAQPPPG
ncbi:MAG: hypothetical protein H6747_08915 [Deltaproteobacteria bacterium]|nr:hypothetical protein [Deltaproteobacteria bacterium]